MYQAGFYRLALNDSDHVDLILNPRETRVDLEFDSIPLQDHMKVIASDENKRLWEYNYVNKETQAVLTATAARRTKLLPTDTASIAALDSADRRAMNLQTNYLDHLASTAPDSYFAKVLRVDKALAGVRGRGARAVANSCNFSDPALLHSSVYDRGVMAYLQNLNITNDHQILAGTDSLVALASGNPDCKNYMVEHLVDLFATYGPQSALEHVINEFAPPGSKVPVPPRLKAKVDALMKLAVGHTAPDISLNDHGTEVPLSSLVKPHRYTAIFFYSSTCEHCHAQMPAMKADLARFHDKGFDVVGIALDVDSTDFLKSISENAIPWRCFSEFNGWGAKSAKAFMVSATPTFFLLDDKLKIVAKPTDADELGKTLVDLYK
ncbi:MAG: TlpA family protein disulfide reductase [Bacteroidetes bacterium]|nr:TlpA family protein disulfide reductase [Bacteroidota bacterium]